MQLRLPQHDCIICIVKFCRLEVRQLHLSPLEQHWLARASQTNTLYWCSHLTKFLISFFLLYLYLAEMSRSLLCFTVEILCLTPASSNALSQCTPLPPNPAFTHTTQQHSLIQLPIPLSPHLLPTQFLMTSFSPFIITAFVGV